MTAKLSLALLMIIAVAFVGLMASGALGEAPNTLNGCVKTVTVSGDNAMPVYGTVCR